MDKHTTVKFNDDALEAVYAGVTEVCEAVATTLGPLGRNVLIDKGYGTIIVHDGVSVAAAINPEEPFKKNGARVIQEAAKKQRDSVGDGTTAVMILAEAIVNETKKARAAKINPMLLRRGLESGAAKVVNKIASISTPIKPKDLDKKIQIATISSQDEELGKMIAETVHKVGAEGVITVEESKAADTFVEVQEGMQIDKGYAHSFMVTDDERQVAVLEDTAVLVTDYPLDNIVNIGKFLDNVVFPNTKKLLFIAPEIGTDFMNVLLNAKMQGLFYGIAVRAPSFASLQTEILQDICALTGATFITKEANMKFDDLAYDVLGQAQRIVCSKTSTIITNGAGHQADVKRRIQVIRTQMKAEDISDYEHEQLKGRLAKLTNGVAVIKVAGQTEVEMKERKERAIDAIQATQAACQFGAVPGGEIVYLECLDVLDESILGEKILKDALTAPFKILVKNAGYDSGQMLEKLSNASINGSGFIGIDVTDGTFKDMVKSGIVDPTSVPTEAVKNAVSIAVQLSSLGAAVVLNNEERE